ncbi:MAG: phosphoenolpyruvate hydrolase family protein [Planctomycetes bacterium]|nr:phosphoenolpyruvate hydrolase family protein [Planctomycetota bacterium]
MLYEPIRHSRTDILKRFRAQIARGEPIIGGGAGTGISAKSEEAGGIDLLIVYNSGRYRMAGRGSTAGLMPYGNANQIVKEMAYEVLPVVKRTPVLAGVCGTDPFIMPRLFLEELAELGYAGIQNFPTVGLIEGELRATLEETGMGYGLEVEFVALARELDLLTTPYVFDEDEARAMTKAGADIVVAHMGCTSGGTIGAKTVKTIETSARRIEAIVAAAKSVRRDVICLCHGGPIATPDDARAIFERVDGIDGFYGASSTERFPTEVAIKRQIEEFKALRLARNGKGAAKKGAR